MEADDRQSATRSQGFHCQRQGFLQRFQFAIDCDPQGLEGLRGRVVWTVPSGGFLDDISQLPGACDWPSPQDGMGNAPGSAFLAVTEKHIHQFIL
jgi:hypothetical protein